MMNLVNYVEKQYSNANAHNLSKEELELASKVNNFFTENKPLFRQDVLDYFGMSKHMFYKLKEAKAIQVPKDISSRANSCRNKGKTKINEGKSNEVSISM